MQIVIFVYDGFTALDAVGPYEVISRLPGASTTFAAPSAPGPVTTDNGVLTLQTSAALTELEACDLLLVPGGPGSGAIGEQPQVKEALQRLDRTSRVTATVCTGSLIAAAAGLLTGKRATCHWAFLDRLEQYGAIPESARAVRDGKYYSAAGVSAGIDMALQLTADLTAPELAQAIQLGIEYDPQPPFEAGHPDRAPAEITEAVRARLRKLD